MVSLSFANGNKIFISANKKNACILICYGLCIHKHKQKHFCAAILDVSNGPKMHSKVVVRWYRFHIPIPFEASIFSKKIYKEMHNKCNYVKYLFFASENKSIRKACQNFCCSSNLQWKTKIKKEKCQTYFYEIHFSLGIIANFQRKKYFLSTTK